VNRTAAGGPAGAARLACQAIVALTEKHAHRFTLRDSFGAGRS
jgi:hypothetical protein